MIFLYVFNTLGVIALAIRGVRRPTQALTWVILGLILPVFILLIYELFHSLNPGKRPVHRLSDKEQSPLPGNSPECAKSISKVVSLMTGNPVSTSDVCVLKNGEQTYSELIQCLRRAAHSIDLEYYIFRNDKVGKVILDLLLERVQRGVRVRLMVDGFGSRKLCRESIRGLQRQGILCRVSSPLRSRRFFSTVNHRDHCKIVVVDGHQAFVGGINIGKEYVEGDPNLGPWRDTHLKVCGEGAQQLERVFQMNWDIANPVQSALRRKARDGAKVPVFNRPAASTFGEWAPELSYGSRDVMVANGVQVQTVESGPDREIQAIRNLFFICLNEARTTVDITTPYFVPDSDIILALQMAVLRGVRVRLLVPEQPDHKIVGMACQTFYPELIDAGVRVYQYQAGLLHAKVMTVDHFVSVVGAANCDLRSFRLNYEVSEVIYSEEVAQQLTKQIEHDLFFSCELTKQELSKRTPWQRTANQAARLLAPLI